MKVYVIRKPMLVFGISLGLALTASQATAKLITLGSDFEFSGATPPASLTPPWLTTTFDDGGGTGSVVLTLTATDLTASEFVSGWYLNLDPALDVSSLVFSSPTKVGSFTNPAISLSTNAFKADGDGKYDILLEFDVSAGVANRFTAGDSVSYTITGIATLTADSFNFLSLPAGGHGPYIHAEHVQGIGSESLSGWVSGDELPPIPEPATMSLLAVGSLALLRRRR
jgi:hypothetical protein